MRTMTYLRSMGLALVSFALLAGCDSPGFTRKGAKAPNAAVTAAQAQPVGTTQTTGASLPAQTTPETQTPILVSPNLGVSDFVARECGIKPREADNATAPTFDFDSSALAQADRDILADLAKCMTEGALRGRDVALVGRTDARGEQEYNLGLGDSRATAVERYLVDLGVGKPHLKPTSRGELDATGKDEAGWAKDRRVDIELAL